MVYKSARHSFTSQEAKRSAMGFESIVETLVGGTAVIILGQVFVVTAITVCFSLLNPPNVSSIAGANKKSAGDKTGTASGDAASKASADADIAAFAATVATTAAAAAAAVAAGTSSNV